MVRPVVGKIYKKIFFISLILIFYSSLTTKTCSQTRTAYTTFLVSVTIESKCETNVSEPTFVDDNFLSLKIVSDVTVICNNDSKPIIKIISKNIKELLDNNYAIEFKKNKKDIIGFIPDSLVQLASNSSAETRLDYEDESFSLKNNSFEKMQKINFQVPKLILSKADNMKYLKFQSSSSIVFEITY